MSRTPKNETPSDLARANGHHDIALLIDSFPVQKPQSRIVDWYHPTINRKQALDLFREHGNVNGTYLIRNGKVERKFVLSLVFEMKTYHFEIEKQGIYFFLDQGPYMHSLEHLVDHYSW